MDCLESIVHFTSICNNNTAEHIRGDTALECICRSKMSKRSSGFCFLSLFHLVPKEWRCELVIPKLLLASCWKSCGISGLVPIHEKFSYRKEKFSSLSLYKNTTDITIYKYLWLKNQTLRTSAAVHLGLALPSCWLTHLCTGAIGTTELSHSCFLHASGQDNSAWEKMNEQNQDENNHFLHEIQTSLGTFSSNAEMFRDFGTTHLSFSTCGDAALLSTKRIDLKCCKIVLAEVYSWRISGKKA